MGKLYLKKNLIKLPKFIIIEGFWQIGKGKLIDYLDNKFNYIVIAEPDHLIHNIKGNISEWYCKKHRERHKNAIKQFKNGKQIILERSIISSIAFDYAKDHKFSSVYQKDLEAIRKLKDFLVIFLYASKNFVRKRVLKVKDTSVKKQILNNDNFYQNYLDFYKNILPPLIDHKILFIKVDYKNKFKSSQNIIKNGFVC